MKFTQTHQVRHQSLSGCFGTPLKSQQKHIQFIRETVHRELNAVGCFIVTAFAGSSLPSLSYHAYDSNKMMMKQHRCYSYKRHTKNINK